MSWTLLGRKIGMTRVYTEDGVSVPVTVVSVGPCVVTQIKTAETDGYDAVQIGFEDVKPRNATFPIIAHDAKAKTGPKRFHREFRVDDPSEYEVGQELGVDLLNGTAFVDVSGTSKGKGFQGTMKRHNFRGQEASHGVERKHRSPGSIAGHGANAGTGPKIMKGKKMSGHMGAERVTVRSLDVMGVSPERAIALIKGPVPGPNKGLLELRLPSRLRKGKKTRQEEVVGS
jgi:large subunit ribosomal protein L3